MTTKDLPQAIRDIENTFIPMSDGERLAARMWLPQSADEQPVPAILEFIPYRKRDFMRTRDEPMHRYYAAHGYAAVRVDVRGSGDSSGILDDEYTTQEQKDAVEIIAWLASQPWCDGNVGMTGISWGGFNALQVAAHRPPALKAIITLCASDDRYTDDAHYMGGCLLNENQIWGTVLFALNALPPDPEIVGADSWRDAWFERLKANHPFPALWLQHQHRDDYWKQGSVCVDFSRIQCPVYAIGGWADGYTNAVFRLLEGLEVPRKGLIGPWAHAFPHNGVPGPAIGYLQEALRWWDRWLKGKQNGIEQEPRLRAWMQEAIEPETVPGDRPGYWIAEQQWPSPRIQALKLQLDKAHTGAGLLAEDRETETDDVFTINSIQSTGMTSGVWCEFGSDGEAPRDQRLDDSHSLTFDTAPLSETLEIFGAPTVELSISVDQPVASLAVRLCEVFSSGSSARITYGILNLTHRDGHEDPQTLTPGEPITVRVSLNHIAHRFAAGSSIRLAISTAYWPTIWPAPQVVNLRLFSNLSLLCLPVRPRDQNDLLLPSFAPPESAESTSTQRPLAPTSYVRTVERDLTSDVITYRMISEGGDLDEGARAHIEAISLDVGHRVEREFRISDFDPLSARAIVSEHLMLSRAEWHIEIDAKTTMRSTAEEFLLHAELDAFEGKERVFSRRWDERIPRKLV